MGFNSAFNPNPANVENMASFNNASRWQMGFNSAFNPYPANVENMVSSYIIAADGRWDLTQLLKG